MWDLGDHWGAEAVLSVGANSLSCQINTDKSQLVWPGEQQRPQDWTCARVDPSNNQVCSFSSEGFCLLFRRLSSFKNTNDWMFQNRLPWRSGGDRWEHCKCQKLLFPKICQKEYLESLQSTECPCRYYFYIFVSFWVVFLFNCEKIVRKTRTYSFKLVSQEIAQWIKESLYL